MKIKDIFKIFTKKEVSPKEKPKKKITEYIYDFIISPFTKKGNVKEDKKEEKVKNSIINKIKGIFRKNTDNEPLFLYVENPETGEIVYMDFNKKMKPLNDIYFYIAFRDLSQENDFDDLLEEYSKYSIQQLIDKLYIMVLTPESYTKDIKDSSSGKAGEAKFTYSKNKSDFKKFEKLINTPVCKPKNHRKHSNDFIEFQTLVSKGNPYFNEITPKKILILINAVTHNVFETNRISIYNSMFSIFVKEFPELKEILPTPIYK